MPILVAASEAGIHRVEFGDDESTLREKLDADYPDATLTIGSDFEQWLTAVVQQIDSPRVQRPLPLDLRGTPFQQRVWEALLEIPLGATRSYTELAMLIGRPTAVRAAASACAANRIAVLIPCHRVLRSDGGLGGYRWGEQRKRTLLQREFSVMQYD